MAVLALDNPARYRVFPSRGSGWIQIQVGMRLHLEAVDRDSYLDQLELMPLEPPYAAYRRNPRPFQRNWRFARQLVNKLWINLLLAACNGRKSGFCAVSSAGLLATMKAQQAVAISFVGRRVTVSTCLFFDSSTALVRAFTSLRDMSFRRNGQGRCVFGQASRDPA